MLNNPNNNPSGGTQNATPRLVLEGWGDFNWFIPGVGHTDTPTLEQAKEHLEAFPHFFRPEKIASLQTLDQCRDLHNISHNLGSGLINDVHNFAKIPVGTDVSSLPKMQARDLWKGNSQAYLSARGLNLVELEFCFHPAFLFALDKMIHDPTDPNSYVETVEKKNAAKLEKWRKDRLGFAQGWAVCAPAKDLPNLLKATLGFTYKTDDINQLAGDVPDLTDMTDTTFAEYIWGFITNNPTLSLFIVVVVIILLVYWWQRSRETKKK